MKFKKVASAIIYGRTKMGVTQTQLAKHLGYTSAQYVSNMERGIVLPPSKKIDKIAKYLNLNPVDLRKVFAEEKFQGMFKE